MGKLISAITGMSNKRAIVAEVKTRSPEYPDLLRGRDPVELACSFETAGAVAISYITTTRHFGGSLEVLKRICDVIEIPVLRKDFVKSRRDIEQTAEAGASALLLIASHHGLSELQTMIQIAQDYTLDALVEVHSKEDIQKAIDAGSDLIGINNRDINQFEMDGGTVAHTELLHPLIPAGFKTISMSGISSLEDVSQALRMVDAVLIGTALMLAANAEQMLKNLIIK